MIAKAWAPEEDQFLLDHQEAKRAKALGATNLLPAGWQ